MKIEEKPRDKMYFRKYLSTIRLENKEEVELSTDGLRIVVSLPNGKNYEVSIPSIVEDVIEFDKKGE